MTKATRAQYRLEFKQEAVRIVESGQSIAAAARSLGVVEQTLYNWVKAKREGRLKGPASSKAVRVSSKWKSAVCERSWRASRWSATSWEKRRRTSRKARNEIRLYSTSPAGVADQCAVPSAAGERGWLP